MGSHDDSDPDMESHKPPPSDSDSDFESHGGKKRSAKGGKKAGGNKRRKTEPKGPKINKCHHCRQRMDDNPNLIIYEGHPEGGVEEVIALTNESLVNQLTEVDNCGEDDNRPEYQLTGYTFYDDAGHVVSVDNDMLERNEAICFSGYLRALTDTSTLTDGAIAVSEGGPILAWWICGYGPGESPIIGISTEIAHYYLSSEPSTAYKPVMSKVQEKVFLSKVIIECLMEARDREEELSYEDMMAIVEGTTVPDNCPALTEESLINHAQFVISQVSSYEEAGDMDEEKYMMDAPCMRNLIQLTGLQRAPRKKGVTIRGGSGPARPKKTVTATYTLATTTPLVSLVFEECFSDQIAKAPMKDDKLRVRKVRCGVCEACQQTDCGECNHCKNMVKFGGNGKSKQACARRNCQNMIERGVDNAMSDDEDADEDLDEDIKTEPGKVVKAAATPGVKAKNQMGIRDCFISLAKLDMDTKAVMKHLGFKWAGEAIGSIKDKDFYSQVLVGKSEEPMSVGDFVYLRMEKAHDEKEICQIVFLYEKRGEFFAHLKQFQRGCYTVLEETSDKRELFEMNSCFNSKLSQIDGKANVTYWPLPDNWGMIGGTIDSLIKPPTTEKGAPDFFYRMRYTPEHARFELAEPPCKVPSSDEPGFCSTCRRNEELNVDNKLKPFGAIEVDDGEDKENGDHRQLWSGFVWERGISYRVGDAVFLTPKQNTKDNDESGRNIRDDVDETTYPEYYRKTAYVKGSNEKTPNPFDIAIILEIYSPNKEKDRVKIKVRNLYRPAQTNLDPNKAFKLDLNFIYWSNDERTVDAENVQGKCFVRPETSLPCPADEWSEAGEYRFYYNQMYNRAAKQFSELPYEAENYGRQETKGKGKGKGKGKSSATQSSSSAFTLEDGGLPHVPRPLRMLDVFAGCGGLSQGLHEAGIADSHWAIEVCEPAAKAFKQNNPKCTVFTDDCNVLLKKAMEAGDGEALHNGKRLPQKGEVELLCGGPPCQGFSGMNRFNTGEYSKFKNSLIASYLAYCDFYRPKFFILENVRNFASYKKSLVLKLCLRSLVKMGYQCTFGVLQAGQYGVAQTRRRCILLAAAPGYKLPLFPEPLHVFYSTSLKVTVNDTLYVNNQRWTSSAPYRTITVRDIMSDLPAIRNGEQKPVMKYDTLPECHFQRMMRKNTAELTDHICKQMNPLVEKRMELIPTEEGSDWRDLPNIVTKLSDGSYSQKLIYSYHDVIQGKGKNGALRGVCHCAASRKKCVDPDKQENTLIPWCLPHTSNRHNHWAGLYGRVSWNGFFSTTVTNPEPMGKQGRVLHPEQARVVSVRECARSQGFHDDFHLFGTILDKHRQVGNAVPPPMGRAIGVEIRKVFGVTLTSQEKAEAAAVKKEVEDGLIKDCGDDENKMYAGPSSSSSKVEIAAI